MICLSAPVTSRGNDAPPLPTTALGNRSTSSAAANRTAPVPTSGPTTWGWPSPHWSMSRSRNPPIARGDSRVSLRWEQPNPGKSIATRWVCSASLAQVGSKASRLSGHGLSKRA